MNGMDFILLITMLLTIFGIFSPKPFTTVDQAFAIGQRHGLKTEDYFDDKGLKALQDYGVHLTSELVVDLRDHAFNVWVKENPV